MMNKRHNSFINYALNEFSFDTQSERMQAERMFRCIQMEQWEDWVDGKGGNFNQQVSKTLHTTLEILFKTFGREYLEEHIQFKLNEIEKENN